MSVMSKQVHSVIFGDKNSYDDWHLVPTSRPVINPPEVKTEYVDILGMDGSIDFTEVLGGVKYKNRTGSIEFLVLNDYVEWHVLYNKILTYLHGKKMRLILEDDPMYYYEGRMSVNQWKSNKNNSTIVINYNLSPYKTPVTNTGDTEWQGGDGRLTPTDWLWDELFSNNIYYGVFDVDGEKWRNILNDSADPTPVTITVTSAMTVIFGETEIQLPDGKTENAITIQPGDNVMKFVGNGRVTVAYNLGDTL